MIDRDGDIHNLFPRVAPGERECIHCPYCGYDYVHITKPLTFSGNDRYEAAHAFLMGVRGDVHAILFEGECGHSWALAFGSHKGQIFYEIVRRNEQE